MTVATALEAPRGEYVRQFRAYRALASIGARNEFAARATLAGRVGLLCCILLIFSRLWTVVLNSGALPGLTRADLVWYIVITELVVLSFPYIHLQVEEDLRSGELTARLPQPVPYIAARIAEAAGGVAVRVAFLLPAGAIAATVFGGGLPGHPVSLLMVVPLIPLAGSLTILFSGAIGLGALWLHDASPLFWVWQKLVFTLGGLLLPLQVYPAWLRTFAEWTPFGAMLNGPGRMVFSFDPADAIRVALQLLFWNAVGWVGLAWLWSRALRALDGYGG
jgi:ABC-2 type transport system permease protein